MEDEELKQIVGESDMVKKRIAQDEAMSASLTIEQMLKSLTEDQIDNETKIKNEKAFNRKLRAWQAQEAQRTGYEFQLIDRKIMKYSKKFIDTLKKRL